jgi:orotate phosphoribosyltransferase
MEPVPCKTESVVTSRSECYCYIGLVRPQGDPILSAFHDTGAYLRGDFRITSGSHSPEYPHGSLIIGHEVAQMLGARFIFTERDDASCKMVLRRGFNLEAGETAVVVEDIITIGGAADLGVPRDGSPVIKPGSRPVHAAN